MWSAGGFVDNSTTQAGERGKQRERDIEIRERERGTERERHRDKREREEQSNMGRHVEEDTERHTGIECQLKGLDDQVEECSQRIEQKVTEIDDCCFSRSILQIIGILERESRENGRVEIVKELHFSKLNVMNCQT